MKTKRYTPKIGDKVRVMGCYFNDHDHIGKKGEFISGSPYDCKVKFSDGTRCMATEVEPVKPSRPKKEVKQLPSEETPLKVSFDAVQKNGKTYVFISALSLRYVGTDDKNIILTDVPKGGQPMQDEQHKEVEK